MVTEDRWTAAQAYERAYWQAAAEQASAGSPGRIDFYRWRAGQLVERLRRHGLDRLVGGSARVLEIGGGPVGVAAYFPAARSVAIDPLEDYYRSDEALTALRRPHVDYRQGLGEALPLDDGTFDLVIIENCIDHVRAPDLVVREIHRVLAPGGILYLTVNCRIGAGYFVHRLLSRLRIDRGHPHTFTPRRVRSLAAQGGFRVLALHADPFMPAWLADLRSGAARDRAKALLLVSEYVATLFAAKPA